MKTSNDKKRLRCSPSLKIAASEKQQKEVAEDLQILIRKVELQLREQDYERAHEVEFRNASEEVFRGLRILLDEQTPSDRRPAAVTRIREYAGLEAGYQPLTEILKHRTMEQMAKPGIIFPARVEIETELSRNSNYIDGIATLMEKYNLTGWQEPFTKLKSQLKDYDAWITANVLPKARTDFRLPPEEYALALEDYGIDIPPDQVAAMAHQAFSEIQERDETHSGADCEAAQSSVSRLPRCHARTKETATRRGRHSSLLRKSG